VGFSFRPAGCVKCSKECWNESPTINRPAHAAKAKEEPVGVNRRVISPRPDARRASRTNVTVPFQPSFTFNFLP
jgi:hypothetical protein